MVWIWLCYWWVVIFVVVVLGGLGFCCGWQRFVYSGFAFEFCGLGSVVGVDVVVIVGVMKVFWCLDCGGVGGSDCIGWVFARWVVLLWLGLVFVGLLFIVVIVLG